MKRHLIRFPIIALAAAVAVSVPSAHAGLADAGSNRARTALSGPRHGSANDRFIVTYRPQSSEALHGDIALQSVSAAISRSGLSTSMAKGSGRGTGSLSVHIVRKLASGGDLIGVSQPLDDAQARSLMRAIAMDPSVLHVERDVRLHLSGGSRASARALPGGWTAPRQASPMQRWNYTDPRGGANIEKAWELADGKDVIVAVLDTGITRHPGLDLSLADAGYDFIRDALTSGRATEDRAPGGWDPGDWSDTPEYDVCFDGPGGEASSWHGTKAAGIVAGLAGGSEDGAGIAPRAKVLPVRVAGHCGAGYLSDISDAIVWAAGGHVRGVPDNQHPAQVIQLGTGDRFEDGCTETFGLQGAIAEANRRGAVVIAPAGDFGGEVSLAVPASCPGVIAVAATGITGTRAADSSFGSGVALAAPGGRGPVDGALGGFIWSASNLGTTVPTGAGYIGSSGTGLASAHVAGVAALMISAVKQAGLPALTPERIHELLVSTARAFPAVPDRPIGAGILDAHAAVVKALGGNQQSEPVSRLEPGVLRPEQSIAEGGSLLYAVEVPPAARYLHLRSFGGIGDAALYAKPDAAPASDGANADAGADHPGNNEAIVIARPQPGTWYLRVRARQAVSRLAVLANYSL